MVTKFFLDGRRPSKEGTSPLRLMVYKDRDRSYINLDVALRPDQWDERKQQIVNHPKRFALNNLIARKKVEYDSMLLELEQLPGYKDLDVKRIRDILTGKSPKIGNPNLFAARFRSFTELKTNPSTRKLYEQTLRHLQEFDPDLDMRDFKDITADYLTRFDNFMALSAPSKNARNIHLRNIRTVFNAAIDDEITTAYPFRRFKIKAMPTAHRALTVDQLRTLFDYPVEPYARQYLDMFKLIFFLMGINMVDLYNLKEVTADGRIEYIRAKTGKLYSIKVEPEAMEIINRYRGKKKLLNIADSYSNHQDYLHHMNCALKNIGKTSYGKRGAKTVAALFPKLSSYWARHSWATAASSIDIPKDTIAAGLGHGGNTVTDIYIDFDRRKVDLANRKVIDWVLYGKN